MKNNIFKNFVWNMLGSTTNAFVSLFLLIFVTRINGIVDAGIFTFSFSTACMFQVIGLYAGRTYQVTDNNEKINDFDFIYNKIISVLLMLFFGLIFLFVKNYNIYKMCIMIFLFLYKAIEAYSEVLYGIIQKNNKLYKVGFSLFLKGFTNILVFFSVNLLTENVICSIISIIFLNIVIIIFYDYKQAKKHLIKKEKFNIYNILYIFKEGIWIFLLTLFTQYIINAQKYIIDATLSEEYQAIFGIILMPSTVMILCGQFLIYPFLNKMKDHLLNKKYGEITILTVQLSIYILVFSIIMNILSYFIGIPILQYIYGISLQNYKTSLVVVLSGATLFSITYIISTTLIALRKTFLQVIIYSITSIVTYFLSFFLIGRYGISGAFFSYLLSMIILIIQYILIFIFIINKKRSE